MNPFEKILDEIDRGIETIKPFLEGDIREIAEHQIIGLIEAKKIVEKYKNNNGWIPIEEGLPPVGLPLIVTVKDNLQRKPNERRLPVYYEKDSIKDGYHWSWRYGDYAYELLPDVSEIVAWRPLPEPY